MSNFLSLSRFILVLACFAASSSSAARSDDTVFRTLLEKCSTERETFCNSVTPTDLRVAACLYAHEDKASPACAVAIYDGMLAMQIAIGTIGPYVRGCRADLLKLCSTTKPGGGRLYECLLASKDALSSECRKNLEPARQELTKFGLAK